MLKHLIAIVILSLLIIFGWSVVDVPQIATQLLKPYEWALNVLSNVFSPGKVGLILRQLIAMLCLPLITSLIPAFLYWLIRRDFVSVFIPWMWAMWWLQLGVMMTTGSLSLS